jgi:hypothetical protein
MDQSVSLGGGLDGRLRGRADDQGDGKDTCGD